MLVVYPAVIFIPGDLAAWDDSVWNESAWNVCRDGSMDLQHDGESALSYRAYRKSYQYIRKKNIQSFYISRMHSVEIWCIGQCRRFITVHRRCLVCSLVCGNRCAIISEIVLSLPGDVCILCGNFLEFPYAICVEDSLRGRHPLRISCTVLCK